MVEKAGSIEVEIRGDSSKLANDLGKAKGLFAGFGKEIVGILSIGASFAFLDNAIDQMDSLRDRSIRLRTEIGSLQKLEFIGRQNGLSVEELNAGLLKMQATLGSSKSKSFLAGLGLDQAKLQALDLNTQFEVLNGSINNLKTSAEKAAAIRTLFGKQGSRFTELMQADLEEAGKLFDSLGIKITQAQADLADRFNDNKNTLSAIWGGFGRVIAAELLPLFIQLSGSLIKFIQDNGGAATILKNLGNAVADSWNSVIKVLKQVGEVLGQIKSGTKDTAEYIGQLIGRLTTLKLRNSPGVVGLKDMEKELALLRERNQLTRAGGLLSSVPNLKQEASLSSGIPSIIGVWVNKEDEARNRSIASLDKLTKAFDESKNTFIEDLQKNDGKDFLRSILQDNFQADSTQPKLKEFNNANFVETARQIFKLSQGLDKASTSDANFTLQRLPNLFEDLNRQIKESARAGENTFAAEGAVQELKDFVNKKASQKVQVDINVKVDKDGVIQVVANSDQIKTVIDQMTEEKMAKEARMAGVR